APIATRSSTATSSTCRRRPTTGLFLRFLQMARAARTIATAHLGRCRIARLGLPDPGRHLDPGDGTQPALDPGAAVVSPRRGGRGEVARRPLFPGDRCGVPFCRDRLDPALYPLLEPSALRHF